MPILVAALPAGANLFSSPPQPPRINEPLSPNAPPPLPIPKRRAATPKTPPPDPTRNAPPNPGLKSTHNRTRYYKPVSRGGGVIATDGGRSVVVGESGVSYLLPGAPFEFQYSYSETPKARPLAIREPAFLPFEPPTMPRPWTGKAPLMSKKDKERKKKIRLFEPLGHPPEKEEGEVGRVMEMSGPPVQLWKYPVDQRSREEILGDRLTRAEVRALVKPCLSHNRQVNLGRDGLTHNMLELVHTHWRRQQVCKVRCRGVPTVDMDNVCHHLEEKSGGKIIHRTGGIVYLFRGRHYNPRTRPRYPVMLWKPAAPVYPKLIQDAPEGLTKVEADELRRKGQSLLPICKLAKNGIYINLVNEVRDAFEGSHLVKINCEGMHASDYKKIGAKLKELVPCVLLSFDQEQILIWRGRDWKSRFQSSIPLVTNLHLDDTGDSSDSISSGQSKSVGNRRTSTPKMLSLWKRAIDSRKALLLDETELSPDSLLERVEEFDGVSQTAEHSYPALILSSEGGLDASKIGQKDEFKIETDDDDDDDDANDMSSGGDVSDEGYEDYDSDVSDSYDEVESSSVPFGSLPVDLIAERLSRER